MSATVADTSAVPGVRVVNFSDLDTNLTGSTTISGPVQVQQQGTVGVSGSVALTNWPATIGISGSAPLQVWSEGNVGVSGSVTVGGYAANLTGSNFEMPIASTVSNFTSSILGNGGTTASSCQVLAANVNRRGFSLVSDINNTNNWLVAFGTTAATGSVGTTAGRYDLVMPPGSTYSEFPAQWMGAVQAILVGSGSNQFLYASERV